MAAIDVEAVLAKLTDKEKIDLLSGNCADVVLSSRALTAVQVSISGIRKPSQNMAFPHYDCRTGQMACGAPASSMAFLQHAFHAVPALQRLGTRNSYTKWA
jgi:hypothetical protein